MHHFSGLAAPFVRSARTVSGGVFIQGHDYRLCHPPGKEEGQTQGKVAGLFCRTFAAVRGRPATKAFVPGVSPAKLRAEPVPTLPWAFRRFQTAKVWEIGPPVNGLSPKTTTGPGNQKERRCQPEKTADSAFLGVPERIRTSGPALRSTAYHFVNCSYHIFPCCFFANCAAWRQVNLHKFP